MGDELYTDLGKRIPRRIGKCAIDRSESYTCTTPSGVVMSVRSFIYCTSVINADSEIQAEELFSSDTDNMTITTEDIMTATSQTEAQGRMNIADVIPTNTNRS